MPHQHFSNLKPQIEGFENPDLLPRDLREEFESGRVADLSDDLSAFLNTITDASEIFLIVERDSTAIQYQAVKLSNGDVKINVATVPKRNFSPVEPATRF